ncbi:MAG: nucleotidyltransferase family protein [Elusimicrobiota bacterium]
MLTRENVLDILRAEFAFLKNNFTVKRIALFGSFAKNTQKENSDVDIFVEFEKPIGLKFIELVDYLEKILGRKTDVLTPAGVKAIRIKKVAEDIERSIVYV